MIRGSGTVAAALLAVASVAPDAACQAPAAEHRVRYVTVGPGADLEVLDWGGTGPPLVLLAGLGNSAHVFDDFAPLLAGRHRVLGLTRRGFGASRPVSGGFGIDTLVADILAVMDALGLPRAAFAGHSFAGDEMTALARTAPGRVSALVYLDAAHDRTDLPRLAAAAPYPDPPPRAAGEDRASVQGWQAYLGRLRGVRLPCHEVEASLERDPSGDLAPAQGAEEATAAVLSFLPPPAFGAVEARVLAIFALPGGPLDLFPFLDGTAPSEAHRRAERAFRVYRWWEEEQIRRLARLVPHAEVRVLEGAPHHLFLSHADEVARTVARFLEGGEQGAFDGHSGPGAEARGCLTSPGQRAAPVGR